MNNRKTDLFLILILFVGWIILVFFLCDTHSEKVDLTKEINSLKRKNKELRSKNIDLN